MTGRKNMNPGSFLTRRRFKLTLRLMSLLLLSFNSIV
jgi:hypothetical protein